MIQKIKEISHPQFFTATRFIGMTMAALCAFFVLLGANHTHAKDFVGEMKIVKAQHEDTFVKLARDNELGYIEMVAANPYIDPWLPGDGAEILLPARHLLPDAPRQGVVINLPEMRLYHFSGTGDPKTYSIGIGRDGLNSPVGQTKVVRKKEGPTWTPTPRMRREDPTLKATYPPGPDNPLGTHALYLGWPTYAIHGTDKPYGIGRRVSSGCIRMYPEGIKDLFPKVPVGTLVTVVDQPVKAGWIDDTFYVEVHPTIEEADAVEEGRADSVYHLNETDLMLILDKAGAYANNLDWPMIRQAVRDRLGYPIPIATKSGNPPQDMVVEVSKR